MRCELEGHAEIGRGRIGTIGFSVKIGECQIELGARKVCFALHPVIECFVLFGGMRHLIDDVDDVVGVTDTRIERFPRRVVPRLVGRSVIVAHILLPSEVTVERCEGMRPSRVGNVALLGGSGGVDVIVECIDEAINSCVHAFVDFVAAKIHISDEQFVEIGDAFGHDEILRILVEEIVAAHRGECEQSEAERKDILFHESWRLESDAQPEGVGRAEREGGLDREAILGGILPFEFR